MATISAAQERSPDLAPSHTNVQPLSPRWSPPPQPNPMARLGQSPDALIDPATGQPFALTLAERGLMIKVMEAMDDVDGLDLYKRALDHLNRGEQLTLGDVIFLNRPLMFVQQPKYGLKPEEVATARELLTRMRKAATAMTLPWNDIAVKPKRGRAPRVDSAAASNLRSSTAP